MGLGGEVGREMGWRRGGRKKSHLRRARWDWLDAPVKTTHLSFWTGRVQLTLTHGLPAGDGSEKAGVSG